MQLVSRGELQASQLATNPLQSAQVDQDVGQGIAIGDGLSTARPWTLDDLEDDLLVGQVDRGVPEHLLSRRSDGQSLPQDASRHRTSSLNGMTRGLNTVCH